jgi:phage terminase large subunit GpA-like protein
LTIGIDCQQDRVEWQLVGWGRNKERYVIDYNIIYGHISEEECQKGLNGLLKQSWPNSFGRKIQADKVAIDGNAYTEDVWGWVKGHPVSRVLMVRGNNKDTAPLLMPVKKERHTRTGKLLRWSKRFYSFNASVMKDWLYRSCVKEDPLSVGYVHFPRGLEDEYFRQLTSERRVEKKSKDGFSYYQWEKDSGQANEALDTMNQAMAAAIRFGIKDMSEPVWDKYHAERESHPENQQRDIEDLLSNKPAEKHEEKSADISSGNSKDHKTKSGAFDRMREKFRNRK